MPLFGSSDKEEMQRRAALLNPSAQAGDIREMQGRCMGDIGEITCGGARLLLLGEVAYHVRAPLVDLVRVRVRVRVRARVRVRVRVRVS